MKNLQNYAIAAFLLMLTVISANSVVRAQAASQKERGSVQGNWLATLDVGGAKLHLLLKVSKDPSGMLSAKLDSLDQGATDLKIDTIVQQGSAINIEAKDLRLSYEGTLNGS